MAKKSSVSSAPARQTRKRKRSTLVEYDTESLLKFFLQKKQPITTPQISDEEIDYSDIPPLTPTAIKQAKRARVGRPPLGAAPRKMVSIKIDPLVLEEIKRRAKKKSKGYQSLIHEILEEYLKKRAA